MTVRMLGLEQILDQPAGGLEGERVPLGHATSSQAPAMPCRRRLLNSAATSRMAHLRAQAVIATGIGDGSLR